MVRPSVRLSHRSTAAAPCGWFAAERRADRTYRSTAVPRHGCRLVLLIKCSVGPIYYTPQRTSKLSGSAAISGTPSGKRVVWWTCSPRGDASASRYGSRWSQPARLKLVLDSGPTERGAAFNSLLPIAKLLVTLAQYTRLQHSRTIVRECCKRDDESLSERGKFEPRYPKTP